MKCRNLMRKFNLINGKMEWLILDTNYEFKSEIRSSGYSDMLNDSDRNIKYYNALKEIINKMKNESKKIHVLDIGCGSGILSMMALELGADKVTACESFKPMFECARKVLEKNNLLSDKINLIHCNSMDLKIGVNMTEKANILVSEIFDTELIGEGVLPTFGHAVKYLLSENAVIIPCVAKIYTQVITSDFLKNHNWLIENQYLTTLPDSYYNCTGYSSVFDVQASAFDKYNINVIGPPVLIKEINFSDDQKDFTDKVFCSVPYNLEENYFSIVIWWELKMTVGGRDYISTTPSWVRENNEEYHWRDHWLQAVSSIRFLNKTTKSSTIDFNFCHDKFSIWIGGGNSYSWKPSQENERPFCSCGMHSHISRNRLYQLNSEDYLMEIDQISNLCLKSAVEHVFVVSDFSLLSISFPNYNLPTHTVIDNDSVRKLMRELADLNCPINVASTFSALEELPISNCAKIAIVGDPFFIYSLFPWDGVHFWYVADNIRSQHRHTECLIFPRKMCIKGLLVKFDHLHKINKRVKNVQCFDMGSFDDLIHEKDGGHIDFESKFLWEYESYARSEVFDLLTINMTEFIRKFSDEDLVGTCVLKSIDLFDTNGLVLWVAWEVNDQFFIDNSFQSIDFYDGRILWKPITKQAVYFIDSNDFNDAKQIVLNVTFNVPNCNFNFSIIS